RTLCLERTLYRKRTLYLERTLYLKRTLHLKRTLYLKQTLYRKRTLYLKQTLYPDSCWTRHHHYYNQEKKRNLKMSHQQNTNNESTSTTPSGKPIPPRQRKIALLGSRSVGKSSLAVQFVDEHFVESYYPTIEHTFSKTVELNGRLFNLEILDTAGHDEFTILDSRQAIGLDGWALVYSINSRTSFDMVAIIRDKILGFIGAEHVPMVLIANKSDLESQRQISTEEGQSLAAEWKCGFAEASARSGENVMNGFLLALIEVEKELNPDETPKSSGISSNSKQSSSNLDKSSNGTGHDKNSKCLIV
ncbi:hypothetical protein PSTT_13116, partial [Puccinia striiformis]